MTTYIVTSARLNGLKIGDILQTDDLTGVDIEHLIESGHLSPQKTSKSAKPIVTDLTKD